MSIHNDNSSELRRECCDGATVEDDLINSLNYFESGGSTWDYRRGNVASFDEEGNLEVMHSPKIAALILLKELAESGFTRQSLQATRIHHEHMKTALEVIHHILSKG